jgi:hypothetical protein
MPDEKSASLRDIWLSPHLQVQHFASVLWSDVDKNIHDSDTKQIAYFS